jgi:midasin
MIRGLASLVGVSLHEFSMNNDTDATDILGGYEQRDLHRQLNKEALDLKNKISTLLSQGCQVSEISLYGRVIALLSEFPCSLQRLPFVLSSFQEIANSPALLSARTLESILDFIHLLLEVGKETETGKFQWYDGILVEAVTEGAWIVLDNANLCNPSVLDRLNSLLEPDGFLVIHESTEANGEPRLLRPHPNFRLFLTMDARHGELSRAMRNRAIEVAVEPLNVEKYMNCMKFVRIR